MAQTNNPTPVVEIDAATSAAVNDAIKRATPIDLNVGQVVRIRGTYPPNQTYAITGGVVVEALRRQRERTPPKPNFTKRKRWEAHCRDCAFMTIAEGSDGRDVIAYRAENHERDTGHRVDVAKVKVRIRPGRPVLANDGKDVHFV